MEDSYDYEDSYLFDSDDYDLERQDDYSVRRKYWFFGPKQIVKQSSWWVDGWMLLDSETFIYTPQRHD